ncbi:hypothetical protein AB7M69_006687 [Bradyrhizobium japonicum]
MYSYHIVAELRQFRGALAATDRRIHRPLFWQTSLAGTDSRPCGLTAMDRFFLAMMVSAVLLLNFCSSRQPQRPARSGQAQLRFGRGS